jgi:hypothetical protein
MRADCLRSTIPMPASKTASTAMSTARPTTVPVRPPSTISSTTFPAKYGVATVNAAAMVLSITKVMRAFRWGRANFATRLKVARPTDFLRLPFIALSSAIHPLMLMSIDAPCYS